MAFTNEQIERYSRHIILKEVGVKGQKKLLNAKVLVSFPRYTAAARSSSEKSLLQKIRLVHVFKCNRILIYRCCKCFKSDRAAVIELNNASEHSSVERIKAAFIYFEP